MTPCQVTKGSDNGCAGMTPTAVPTTRCNSQTLPDSELVLSALSLTAAPLLRSLELTTVLDSTNTALLHRPAADMHAAVLVAEAQTAGRGRTGKSWYSPSGAGVYFSCGWVSVVPPKSDLSPAVAAEVVAMLVNLGLAKACVRHPNDIYVGTAKLGGILIECHSDGYNSRNVVGIGINTIPSPGRSLLERSVTDLASAGVVVEPHIIVAGLINVVLPLLARHLPEQP